MLIGITIEGRSPLICNRFSDAAAEAATNGTRGSSAGSDRGTPQEIAEGKLYKSAAGVPFIPGPNVFSAIIAAGRFFKNGKSQITTAKSSLIPAAVVVQDVEIPIVTKGGWSVDSRPVRIPATGGRILAFRPIFYDWSLTFSVDLDEKEINAKLFRQIVDAAGSKVGLGDFRPACRGPYGRFDVTNWDVQVAALPLAA